MRKEIEMLRSPVQPSKVDVPAPVQVTRYRPLIVMALIFLVIMVVIVGTSVIWATQVNHTPYNGPRPTTPTPMGGGLFPAGG